jgi:tryptophan halogenase
MKKITIVGGGTAGLIAAIVIKQSFPNFSLSLIESDSIGIIGVGEGSTEHWRQFVQHCNLDIRDLIRSTEGSLKKGIKFENWNGDGKSYFHSLGELYFKYTDPLNKNTFLKTLIINGIKTEDILTDTNLVDINSGIFTVNQYHFNTIKLNEYLHRICSERDITIIKDTIKDVVLTSTGDVDYLIGEGNEEYKAEFFIDSTGFRRIVASKVGAKFVSYKKYLPMNHALAFPTSDVSDLKPYTLSRALSSGWNWRIPTQTRYGNGYVFCDEFMTSTQAHDEVQSVYSEEVKVAKDIKFEAGRADKFWINNCLSIGLSASFVEPLEASSIGNTILQAFSFCDMFLDWCNDRTVSDDYNKWQIKGFDNIVDFVQLHYFTKRNDSLFWKTLPDIMVKTDFNEQYLEYFKKNLPSQHYFNGKYNMFNSPNWAQVIQGLELYDTDAIKQNLILTHGEGIIDKESTNYETYLSNLQKENWIEHGVLLSQNNIVVKFDRK